MTGPVTPGRSAVRRLLPGLGLAAVLGVAAVLGAERLGPLSPLVLAMALGVVVANSPAMSATTQPGLKVAGKKVLRVGIVLLGFRLSLGDVAGLGVPAIAAVVGVVTATFFGTQWLGRRLGLGPDLSLLVATGYSICGASAIAAVEGVVDADEEDVAVSVALVTLCGTIAVLVLPILGGLLGLPADTYGAWVGASVHDVGQVVAAATGAGAAALAAAVLVKLTRVVLLAPVVAGVSWVRRGKDATAEAPPLVPLFVVGFLGAVVLRTIGVIPQGWLASVKQAETLILAVAMVGLGAGVHWARLRRLDPRVMVLGAMSWALVAGAALVAVTLT
jgi:uncharacterized integral membrane protein (TIGR00698 family)